MDNETPWTTGKADIGISHQGPRKDVIPVVKKDMEDIALREKTTY